jgi:hypothetical protein
MGFKARTTKNRLALNILETDAGQALVRQRLKTLEEELSGISRQQSALEKERDQLAALVRRSGAGRPNGAGRRRRGISTDRVLAAVDELIKSEGSPPTRAQIAAHLNTANKARLTKPLEALIAEGTLERVGRGRGTAYKRG